MIYNEQNYLKVKGRAFFIQWKRNRLLNIEAGSGYFRDAYKTQNPWGYGLSLILTLVCSSACFGFFSMLINFTNFVIPVFITLVASVLFCERRIKQNGQFRTGEIDALILTAGVCAISLIPALGEFHSGTIYWGLAGTIVFTALYFRYLSQLAFFAAFGFFCFLVFVLVEKQLSAAILPFSMMFIFGAFYSCSGYLFKKASLVLKPQVLILRSLSMIMLMLSGNYYVVRVLSEELLGSSGEIRFAWFFYLYSTAFPLLMIFQGLRKHDRSDLVFGILGLLAGILGIRAFHSIIPIEYALTIGGIVLITIGYLSTLGLRKPFAGITSVPEASGNRINGLNNVLVGYIVSERGERPSDSTLQGGGSFGGGGAGSKF